MIVALVFFCALPGTGSVPNASKPSRNVTPRHQVDGDPAIGDGVTRHFFATIMYKLQHGFEIHFEGSPRGREGPDTRPESTTFNLVNMEKSLEKARTREEEFEKVLEDLKTTIKGE
ncbi:unnamed protein product [Pleuronectes platessa]|uniref:Uncharacterized protein n=1 Tax=Pleuronectes platessa TaxID=8262 RepID=A0A9N7U175_PLEPL|nr:unnamed protein product [Pleuronectes platessa]